MVFGLSNKVVGVALLIVAFVVTAFWMTTTDSGSNGWKGQLDEKTITGFQSCLSNVRETRTDDSKACISDYFSVCGSVDFDYSDCLEELILAADEVTNEVLSRDPSQQILAGQFLSVRNGCSDKLPQANEFALAQCRFMATVGFFVIEVD
jgi:hypothetical protein